MGCGASAAQVAADSHDFHATFGIEDKIGSGSYGVVYQTRHRLVDQDTPFAVKILPKKSPNGSKESTVKRRFDREVDMLTLCKSKNVIELFHVFQNRHFCYAVMEHGHCTVLQALVDSKVVHESHIQRVLAGMTEGVMHCHKMKVVHRDIKPQNFLLTQGSITDEHSVVKLSDFGLAKTMPDGFDCLTEISGTCPFMAPEMVQNLGYNYKVDVWSLGVSAYLMLFGAFPYDHPSAPVMLKMIESGETPISFQATNHSEQPSQEAIDFLKKLLHRDPHSRPTATGALLMPYLKSARCNMQSHSNDVQSNVVNTMKIARLLQDSLGGHLGSKRAQSEDEIQKLVLQLDARYAGMTPPFESKPERSVSDASTECSSSAFSHQSSIAPFTPNSNKDLSEVFV